MDIIIYNGIYVFRKNEIKKYNLLEVFLRNLFVIFLSILPLIIKGGSVFDLLLCFIFALVITCFLQLCILAYDDFVNNYIIDKLHDINYRKKIIEDDRLNEKLKNKIIKLCEKYDIPLE